MFAYVDLNMLSSVYYIDFGFSFKFKFNQKILGSMSLLSHEDS